MCLAYPGKIKSIKNSTAWVDFNGIEKAINISIVPKVKVGEYVIVHAGFAIEILSAAEGTNCQEIFKSDKNETRLDCENCEIS